MGSTRRSFTDEYKRDAVSLILDGGHTIGEVAKKLEISETSIRKWVKKIQPQGEPAAEKPLTESERTELARLRTENAKLEMQLEFSKKVSTWFAKGQQWFSLASRTGLIRVSTAWCSCARSWVCPRPATTPGGAGHRRRGRRRMRR